ncbi:MAG: sigma-70 family RNA polymerase sigma factor [Myxococcaceae bacterium]|jgi:RNA polymerase sigma-70 factor|nr:sigma-70 family RNA polymerase sigma factor [Myxococcaceae bacterium]MCA3015081.1 sigma-70 family RNA polymerase sigma factor [Myxococcaceae bacterium]
MSDGTPLLETWLAAGAVKYPGVTVSPAQLEATLRRLCPDARDRALLVREDVVLVTGCLCGDAGALGHLDGLVSRLCATAGQGLDTAELGQRVRLLLLVGAGEQPGRLASWAGRGALVKWLSAVIHRAALNLVRELKPAAPESALDERSSGGESPEAAFMRAQDATVFNAALKQALDTLPERSRHLLRLYYLEGFTAEQIARIEGAHRVSVARWLGQAKRALRATTRERLAQHLSPSHVDSLMRLSNAHFAVSLEGASRRG